MRGSLDRDAIAKPFRRGGFGHRDFILRPQNAKIGIAIRRNGDGPPADQHQDQAMGFLEAY